MKTVVVNAVGDQCPIPVVKTLKAMSALTEPSVIEVLVDAGVPGRLIPVPRLISASCGMAFSAPPEARAQVEAAAAAVGNTVDCIYELEI